MVDRNDLLILIVFAVGGVVTGLTQNELLQDWLNALGG
jgi:hypothetical protein